MKSGAGTMLWTFFLIALVIAGAVIAGNLGRRPSQKAVTYSYTEYSQGIAASEEEALEVKADIQLNGYPENPNINIVY